jgi:hypothetical protein
MNENRIIKSIKIVLRKRGMRENEGGEMTLIKIFVFTYVNITMYSPIQQLNDLKCF